MKRKLLTVTLLIIAVFGLFVTVPAVKADSGFDSSFGGGSSGGGGSWSSGGSSWDSGSSSWDSGSSYSHSSSSSTMSTPAFILFLVMFALIMILSFAAAQRKQQTRPSRRIILDHSKEVPIEKIKEILPNFNRNDFYKARYQDFIDIQNAWMNFDYDKLRSKLTDELYNQYEMQLQTLSVKGQKNVMSDFTIIDTQMVNITKQNNQITVTMQLQVAFLDYLEKNGKVVRGSNTRKNKMTYEMAFVCNETTPDTCPNCGAKLTNKASQKCPYCNSTIAKVSKDWVLSKKEALGQE